MTNEKAYEILKNSECFGAVELYKKDEIEAFHIALEALKAEPCEDTISRKHLLLGIDELMQSPWFNNGKDFYDNTMRHYGYVERKEAVEVVRDMCVKEEPPVTPKQKTGKWIKDKNLYKCTVCNDLCTVAGWASCIPEEQMYKAFKYCPNCGVRMEEQTNEGG